ncbi:P-loop containing nucleoside triphosphate hydrolase protein, partial [Boletus coccyginus]
NIVLFGECGVGKSSIINAIVGRPVAKTSNDVFGCTNENAPYSVTLDTGVGINLWDTIGLDEGTAGKVPTDQAKQRLQLFLQRIEASEAGIDLLLFCFRAGRPRLRHARNYNLFHAAICRKKVPVAIAVLGPEEEADTWWQRNEQNLRQKGFRFD